MNTGAQMDKFQSFLKTKADSIDILIATMDTRENISNDEIITLLMKTIDIAGEVIEESKNVALALMKRNQELEKLLAARQ